MEKKFLIKKKYNKKKEKNPHAIAGNMGLIPDPGKFYVPWSN